MVRPNSKAVVDTVTVSREEFDRLQLLAGKNAQSVSPGFQEDTPDSYVNRQGQTVSDLAKGIRTLPNGSSIILKISPNGWLSILPDFIPPQRGKSPRPGFGGYMNRHRGYAEYFRSKEYLADLRWATENGAKDAPSA
jgi:hypothetical protein